MHHLEFLNFSDFLNGVRRNYCGRENEKKVRERETLPSEGDLDRCGEAGGEEVGREVGVHGQQLAGLAGSQLDAVLH